MPGNRRMTAILGLALMAWAVGCKQRQESEVKDATVVVGDPKLGYYHLVNSNYTGCGIPVSLLKNANKLVSFMPGAFKSYFLPSTETDFVLDKPELPEREGDNAWLPYYLNGFQSDNGVAIANMNCLSCHGEKIDGKVVIGMGNVTRDFTHDLTPITKAGAVLSLLRNEDERKEWKLWSRSIKAMAPYMIPKTIGANPAVNVTYALIAHLDRNSLVWREEPYLAPPSTFVPPVDVPPWWRLKHRKTVFYNAEFKGDHRRYMMLASTMCIDGLDMARRIEQMFYHVDAFIMSVEPPKYPYEVNKALADKGKSVFEAQCSSCHGRYGEDGVVEYSENIVKWDVIKTDPELMKMQVYESERFRDWVNNSWYGELGHGQAEAGYVAPPLNGIWATAPFFHNGSVPTIEAVLDSSKRPQRWERPTVLKDFDEKAIGWKYKDLSNTKVGLFKNKSTIYDTTEKGYSNSGHTYGDALKVEERAAVLEYLKTL